MSIKSSLGRQFSTQFDTVFDVVKSNPIYDKAGGSIPSLDLNFAKTKSLLDSRSTKNKIRFARASSGTYFGADGLIKTTPVNLHTYSEDLTQSYIAANLINGTASAANVTEIDPSGSLNSVSKITLTRTATTDAANWRNYIVTSGSVVFSVYVKAATSSDIGKVISIRNEGNGTGPNTSVSVTLTDSWQRVVTPVFVGSTVSRPWFGIYQSTDSTGTVEFLAWGAQLEEGTTATDYIPTTSTKSGAPRFDHDPATGESLGLLIEEARTNLITYSEEFDNTGWLKNGNQITFSANVDVAPDGTFTADQVNNVPNLNSWCRPEVSISNSITYTFSLYVKPLTTNKTLVFEHTGGGNQTSFNLDTLTTSGAGTHQIIPISNGWYRIVWTFTGISGLGGFPQFPTLFIGGYPTTSDSASFLFWGAQVEEGSFPTSYIPTPATFVSRASTATYYDATGTIQTALVDEARSNAYLPDENGVMRPAGLLLEAAGTNLLSYSEEFDSSPWVASIGAVITANANTAPDGTVTADQVSSGRIERYDISYASGVTYTFSIFVKGTSGQTVGIGKFVAGSDGDVVLSYATLNGTWQRLSYTFTSPITASTSRVVISGANDKFGTATNFLVWGAQLEATPYATSYIPTTTSTVTRAADISTSATVTRAADVAEITGANFAKTNLLQYSERFDQSYWFKISNPIVIPNSAEAPDGSQTATTFNQTNSVFWGLYGSVNVTPNTTYTFSFYVKQGTSTSLNLRLRDRTAPADIVTRNYTSEVNTSTWTRVVETFTTPVGCTSLAVYPFNDCTIGTAFLWGAQLEEGSVLTDYTPSVESFVSRASSATYVDDTTGLIATAAVDTARYENNELILEEARTNEALYSVITQANWFEINGASITDNQAVSPDGTSTAALVDFPSSGIPRVEVNTVNTAGVRTVSCWVRAVSGTVQLRIGNSSDYGQTQTIGTEWTRIFEEVPNGSALAGIYVSNPQTAAQFYAWGFQVEEGTYATSYIPTSGSTVTRAADVSTSALGVDSWYNQSGGTWYGEVKKAYPTTQRLLEVGNSVTNQYSVSIRPGPASTFFARQASGSSAVNHSYPAKIAVADSVTDIQGCVNGTLASIVSTGTSPTDDKLSIGGIVNATVSDNTISRLSYFPTRLSDDKLKSITS